MNNSNNINLDLDTDFIIRRITLWSTFIIVALFGYKREEYSIIVNATLFSCF